MRVRCLHGYFMFEESRAGDLSRFQSLYGFSFAPKDTYYTFEHLFEAEDYSIKGVPYMDTLDIAIDTYQGKPWDVMRANKLVYDFSTDSIKPIASVVTFAKLYTANNYFFSEGLLLPGSINSAGQRVTDYTAYFVHDALKFRYTEVLYDQNI